MIKELLMSALVVYLKKIRRFYKDKNVHVWWKTYGCTFIL